MEIETIKCDICNYQGSYPDGLTYHFHPELDIGGVPMNIWSPKYNIFKFSNCNLSDLIPNSDEIIQQGEGNTPLIRISELSNNFEVYLKNEGKNPTGSFKDRGMPYLISYVKKRGHNKIAIPSTGNAAISLIHYANLADLDTLVFVPESLSNEKKDLLGHNIVFDKDLIESYEHFFEFCKKNHDVYNAFLATNIPYLQGLKSIAYETYQQLDYTCPDWLVIPVGSGGNLVSQYNGFKDLLDLGLIEKLPQIVSVQIKGADPITVGYALEQYNKVIVLEDLIESRAEAIASDTCFNYFKIMDALNKTKGLAVSVTDEEIQKTKKSLPSLEFASCSVYAALSKLKHIKPNEKVVLIGTSMQREEN
jgi:threonine synthase